MASLQGLGSRYFATIEEAKRDLDKKRAADSKYAKWDVHQYVIPNIVGLDLPESVHERTVYGCTGGAAVLGWQLAVDAGFEGGKANGGRKQKSADELMSEMSQEERFAAIAKSMSLPIERVRAMFADQAPATAASDKPVDSQSGTTGESTKTTGRSRK
jgi:hypothetical protein